MSHAWEFVWQRQATGGRRRSTFETQPKGDWHPDRASLRPLYHHNSRFKYTDMISIPFSNSNFFFQQLMGFVANSFNPSALVGGALARILYFATW
jgi:hypothetical protein